MFDFRKKVLAPLGDKTRDKVEVALGTQNIADRIEKFLGSKEDTEKSFRKVESREAAKLGGVVATLYACIFWAILAPWFAPTAGIITMIGTAAYGAKKILNMFAASKDRRKLKTDLDTEVRNLATAHPEEAVKSPRFLKGLKERFNLASAGETELSQLRALFAPPTAPAAATAPAAP